MGGASGAGKRSTCGRREMASPTRSAKMPSGCRGDIERDIEESKMERLLDCVFTIIFLFLPIRMDLTSF